MEVTLYQMMDRMKAEQNIKAACERILQSSSYFFCLPEYFAIPSDYGEKKSARDAWIEISKPALKSLCNVARIFKGYIIAGSLVEKAGGKYYNTCFVIKSGEIVAKHRKVNLVDEEIGLGLTAGDGVARVDTGAVSFSILICADCLRADLVEEAARRVELIFLPVSMTDPHHPKVEGHPVSERIARKHGVIVVKVSRISSDGFGVKSAVVAPDEVVEAKSCGEELLVADLSRLLLRLPSRRGGSV